MHKGSRNSRRESKSRGAHIGGSSSRRDRRRSVRRGRPPSTAATRHPSLPACTARPNLHQHNPKPRKSASTHEQSGPYHFSLWWRRGVAVIRLARPLPRPRWLHAKLRFDGGGDGERNPRWRKARSGRANGGEEEPVGAGTRGGLGPGWKWAGWVAGGRACDRAILRGPSGLNLPLGLWAQAIFCFLFKSAIFC